MTSLTQPPPVLEIYRGIADLTGEMLTAAQTGDWRVVLACGQRYCEMVEQLRTTDPGPPLDDADRVIKYDLLVQILENDAATRDLAVPQMARLHGLLGRMKRQQSLLSTYGARMLSP